MSKFTHERLREIMRGPHYTAEFRAIARDLSSAIKIIESITEKDASVLEKGTRSKAENFISER